jgi:amino-acid N-acetyltransferase
MVSSPKSTEGIIRKAAVEDVKHIHRLLNHFGEQGLLLARPLSELYDHVRDFSVLVPAGDECTILGACALGVCWEDLAEIRSLAVAEQEQGKGGGSRLVKACLGEAASFGLKRVFTLTYVERFFVRLGFRRVDKSVLPHKVWADCLRCPKYPDCDETAMIVNL